MPTANARYGRPKGTGLDDRRQLESIAALLAANPKLKPTTAIRALGVEDPSVIRRLRDKFRLEQAKLMADARRVPRSSSAATVPAHVTCRSERTPASDVGPASARPVPTALSAPEPSNSMPAGVLAAHWLELGFTVLSAAAESQAKLTQYWLGLPQVSMALRGQLTVNAIAVAVCTRNGSRKHSLH